MGRNITTEHTEKIFQKALSCPLRQSLLRQGVSTASASAASQPLALSYFVPPLCDPEGIREEA